jgi:PLP dependent protein
MCPMLVEASKIRTNLNSVRDRITRAAELAGRDPASVRLVAVTKAVGVDEVRCLRDLGVTDFGENRPETAGDKIQSVDAGACWHMIGPIQRRKAREVATLFHWADALDRIEAAEALERRAAECGRKIDSLLEVNVSGEASKHGFEPGLLGPALRDIAHCANLHVRGLMTMAPYTDDPGVLRPVFQRLASLKAELGLAECSMGMTNDFEIAVACGATQVRIGSALFI